MAEAALSAWSDVEEFLRVEGYPEEAIVCVLELARQEGLDASLINRVIAIDEREEVVSLH
jgi:hypothetical protein